MEKPPRAWPLTVEGQIAYAQAMRAGSVFTLADALAMPAVIRAVQLTCSLIAQFTPVAYRDGVPLPDQPRLLTATPYSTVYEFLYQTVWSLIAEPGTHGKGGDAYWWITSRDEDGLAREMIVLPPGEVRIERDRDRYHPVYTWRGTELDRDLVHLRIGRPPGDLHGRSPLITGLPALAPVAAAEAYAFGFFSTSGIPSVLIKAPGEGSEDEAQRLKSQWMAAHAGPEATPAVMFKGLQGTVEVEYPSVDAQKAQLQESRAYGATIVARLLGIPAALLHVETSGATITYVNSGGAIDEFVRTTAQPVYLSPIESQYSLLVPRTQTVRFNTAELFRIDLAGRINAYAAAIGAGILTAPEARTFEGWPIDTPIDTPPAYTPTPAQPTPALEVPVNG